MAYQQHYAVVVGINAYPDDEVEGLHSPVNDAKRFAEWLCDPDEGGVPKANIETIYSAEEVPDGAQRREGNPTKTQIHEALYEFGKRCQAQRRARQARGIHTQYRAPQVCDHPRESHRDKAEARRAEFGGFK